MAQVAETFVCPKGHRSTEADYCSKCGAKLQGALAAAGNGGAGQWSTAAGQVCPDCATLREHNDTVFCEVCGYNFATGAHGEVPPAATPLAEMTAAPETVPEAHVPVEASVSEAQRWSVVVSVVPSLRGPDSPEAPGDVPPFTVTLEQPVNLIGRRNEARGIFPEIVLAHDEAVSRRHAVLEMDATGGLLLRDIGAANGTRLNGVEVQPMVDTPLKDGDEITLGHWSRIRVEVG